jgi:4a-hydroxytetrahydrobiopterin dehydratase
VTAEDLDTPLSRTAASDAVTSIGWRYLLGTLRVWLAAPSLAEAVELAALVAGACPEGDEDHVRVDLRPGAIEVAVQDPAVGAVTRRDTRIAEAIAAALAGRGAQPLGSTTESTPRPVQMLELAIDALDIASIRPFWKAVTGFVDEPGPDPSNAGLIDPRGQLPSIWFQQMDSPRPQRNRIHFDLTVAHDEAELRVAAGLAAGGRMVDAAAARSFWVLADAEGNEVCVCTWLDRDERS